MPTPSSTAKIGQEDFGITARKRMLDLGITITRVAKALGLHRNTITLALDRPDMVPAAHVQLARFLKIPAAL